MAVLRKFKSETDEFRSKLTGQQLTALYESEEFEESYSGDEFIEFVNSTFNDDIGCQLTIVEHSVTALTQLAKIHSKGQLKLWFEASKLDIHIGKMRE